MPDQPRCRTCRHWAHPHAADATPGNPHGFCTSLRPVTLADEPPDFAFRVFVRASDISDRGKLPRDGAGPLDPADRTPFVTGPDFGCVRHERAPGAGEV